ncbi:DUF4190 domain-containing protein [Microbacterium suwonense]|uniref:DUF4190 domain-containing protein n=1 Tax=Microbacterium suwonense TaxID=683047 RepID=A0ABM8FVQ4_9MICO|nr:DUF4190 domain-containing protein [Microbacterium suwonense]BDZ39622.1 hypothetical protein GCM10025863_22360 [Microbacterium suwonense]
MGMPDSRSRAWDDIHTPLTTPERLAQVAAEHPEFAAQIGAHPNAYSELREWAQEVAGAAHSARSEMRSADAVAMGPDVGSGNRDSTRSVRGAPVFAVVAWGVALVLLLGLGRSDFIYGMGGMGLVRVMSVLGAIAAVIGAVGAPSLGRRISSIALVVVAGVPSVLFGAAMVGGLMHLVAVSLLFLAWAIAWPLRPLGYLGLPILVVLTIGSMFAYPLYYPLPEPVRTAMQLLVMMIPAAATVAVALWFSSLSHRREAARASSAAFPASGGAYATSGYPLPGPQASGIPPLNTMALLALILAFLPTGPLCVVFGHIGLSQIRRTGERGRGMAIAGLVLGYLWLASLIAGAALFAYVIGAIG